MISVVHGIQVLAEELISNINEIRKGKIAVIVANNLRKKRWIGDAIFDLSDDDDAFGKAGYDKAIQRIHKPYGFLGNYLNQKYNTKYTIGTAINVSSNSVV